MKNVEEMTIDEMYDISKDTSDIELLIKISEELTDRAFIEEANGNLSKLCNLRQQNQQNDVLIDDEFFDNEDISEKYDWDYENECRAYNKSNAEIRDMLDEGDKKAYIAYMKDCICIQVDYLNGV